MGTYEVNGILSAHFNAERDKENDLLGRSFVRKFFEKDSNYLLFDNDKVDGVRDYSKSDMRLEIGKSIFYLEVAIKTNKHWGFVSQGVDVECRKLKYFMDSKISSSISMFSDLNNQQLIIDSKYLLAAQKDCGQEYYGQWGRQYSVRSSPNFQMPVHGCHRVRKYCEYKGKWTKEDFYRIPYKYLPRLEKKIDCWKQINQEECEVRLPDFINQLL